MKKENNESPPIESAIKKIEKDFGKGSIMKLGDKSLSLENKFMSGSLILDKVLGGGVPRGRIIEIYGPESSGKTSLSFLIASQIQKIGGTAAFIDAEHAIDLEFAKKIGVNVDDLIISQPDSGEQAFEIMDVLIESNAFDLIIVDSVAALVPEIELRGDFSDQTIGAHARLMSKALRIMTPKISKSNTTVIFINQIREKIGVMFGSPETTTGGRALKFYSSIRLDLRTKERLRNSDNSLYGQIIKAKAVKNKISEPYKEGLLELNFTNGFNYYTEIIEIASNFEIIKKAGSWYSYNEIKIGQGKEAVVNYLKDNNEIFLEIEAKVKENYY